MIILKAIQQRPKKIGSNSSTAKISQAGKFINVWSDKGNTLSTPDAAMLLDLAKQNNIAIEIDNDTKTPSVEVIKMAKSKGCKFTFSGLIPLSKIEKSQYVLDAIKGAKLIYKDQFVPKYL
jgi:hypothetical protein